MRRIIFPAALLLAALALTGCTSGAASSDQSAPFGGAQTTESDATPGMAEAPGGAGDFASAAGGSVSDPTLRQIVSTGYLTITAEDPMAAGDQAVAIVETAGGRIDGRTEEAPIDRDNAGGDGDHGKSTLVLRIPSARLTPVLDELGKLGDVVSLNTATDDVTTQTTDLDSRITALGTSVDRLLTLLATATDTKILIELETAISSRQGELDSLEAQRRYLADQVQMSAITLQIGSQTDAPPAKPETFWAAVTAGFTGFGELFVGAILVLGYMLPWLLLVGLASAVALLVMRRRQRRKVVV